MTADNYLSVCMDPKFRSSNGPRHAYFFPFDSTDMRTVTAATEAANRAQAHLERHEVPSELAVYYPHDMLDLPIIAGDAEIERQRCERMVQSQQRVPGKRYGKHGVRIGEVAA